MMSGLASPLLSMLMSYAASVAHGKKLGPPAGSENGAQLAMRLTVLGSSGLTNAYVSVLWTAGWLEMYGASRWLDAELVPGPSSAAPPATVAAAVRTASARVRARDRWVRVMELLTSRVLRNASAVRAPTHGGWVRGHQGHLVEDTSAGASGANN